jgi:predicted GNAT family N-acyltransferase
LKQPASGNALKKFLFGNQTDVNILGWSPGKSYNNSQVLPPEVSESHVMNTLDQITISSLDKNDISEAHHLVISVFNTFVANEYSDQGRESFYKFVTEDFIASLLDRDGFSLAAKNGNKIIGIISIRNFNHIALFFVDKEYKNIGIGKKLFYAAKNKIEESNSHKIEVHSSLYAEKIYSSMGFIKVNDIQEEFGIKYVPMEYLLKN